MDLWPRPPLAGAGAVVRQMNSRPSRVPATSTWSGIDPSGPKTASAGVPPAGQLGEARRLPTVLRSNARRSESELASTA